MNPSFFPALMFVAQAEEGTPWIWIIGVPVAIGFLVLFAFLAKFIDLWIRATFARAKIGLPELIGMFLQGIRKRKDLEEIVKAKIQAVKGGLDQVTTGDLVRLYLAKGHPVSVVDAMVSAAGANIPLDFAKARRIDLAGRDVLDAVNTSVYPKVIDCPDTKKGKSEIAAVAKDGIQVLARARVTVRANIERLIGGATEETVIARVGEGIVSAIGSSDSHKDVLENPDRISKAVLEKGLDAGTAFEILSVDIADVDIGTNIGARLQADQAEADKRVAQALAEKRRAMAVAAEQENKAEVMLNRAKVVLAEAEVPLAMASALKSGNLGVMDLYRLRNIESDTDMRRNLGGKGKSDGGQSKK